MNEAFKLYFDQRKDFSKFLPNFLWKLISGLPELPPVPVPVQKATGTEYSVPVENLNRKSLPVGKIQVGNFRFSCLTNASFLIFLKLNSRSSRVLLGF